MNQRVQIWVPFRSIDMADGVMDDVGYVYLTSTLSDFDPDGVSGVSNYGADTEPGYDGALIDGLRGNNVISAPLELVIRGSFSKHNFKGMSNNAGTGYVTFREGEYVWTHSGTGELEPGESHASWVFVENNGTKAFDNPMSCDVFDNTTLQLTDRGNIGATTGTYAHVGAYNPNGMDYTNYIVEYAHFDLNGDDPLDADGDGNRDYDVGSGRYNGNWDQQSTLRCDDATPAGGWFTDPTAIPGGIDAVNAVRARLSDAAKANGVQFEPGHQIRLVIPLMARDSFNGGPYDGEQIPVGTVMPNFAGVRSDNWASGWTARNYTASPENGNRDGDRVTLTRIKIFLDKESIYPEAEPGESASILAGDNIVWKINSSVQSSLANPSDAENLHIVDVLPPEASYNATCTAEQEGATPPGLVEYNTDKDGNPAPGYTRLLWNFGDVTANTIIPPRIFCTDTDPLALHGTDVVNYAEMRADNVITALEERSANHTIKLEQTGSIQVSKKVDMPLDDMNDDQVYTISWANFAPSFTIDAPTIIDVLPFTSGGGDGTDSLSPRTPGSDFHGKLELTGAPSVTWLDSSVPDTGAGDPHAELGTWHYSSDAPETINYDPDTNATEGTTVWCLEADFGTAGCPADFAAVTAMKFVSNYDLAKDGDPRQGMMAEFTLQAGDPGDPNGADTNLPGDIYTNRFTFDSTSLPADQFLRSNNVSVEIAAFSIGDLIFADVNGNGKYDAGTDGTVPDGVVVELYKVEDDGSENKIRETTTGGVGPGRYLFEPLASGTYYVKIPATEFQPGGKLEDWGIAPPTGTDRENNDENEHIDQHGYSETTPNALGVRTGTVTLSANPPPPGGVPTGNEPTGDNVLPITDPTGDDFSNLTLDIGLDSPLSSLGNVVWIDSNNNGLQDPDEQGLTNVTVNLLDEDGNVLQTTRTDHLGYYDFSGLVAGTYVVEVIKPDGYEFGPKDAVADDTADSDVDTTSGRTDPITLEFGQHDTQWDAGLYPLGSIGDRVWIDTNANGLQDLEEADGIAGVNITLKETGGDVVATTTTDADGRYLFEDLPPGNYTVDIDNTNPPLDGYNLTTANDPYELTLAAGQDYRDADFGYVNYASVGDTVWHDLNGDGVQDAGEPGVAGVAVRLLESGTGTIVQSTTTDADGNYLFDDVIPGDYVIEFVLPIDYTGFVANDLGGDDTLDSDAVGSAGKTGTFNLAAGQDRTDIDAGLYKSATLGNLLWLDEDGDGAQGAEESGLPGTQVTLTGTLGDGSAFTPISVVTDENGLYQFSDLYPGEYTVTFDDTGFVTADQGGDDALDSDVAPNGAATVTLASGDNNQTIDAGIAAAAVTGRVWIDNNTQDAIDNGTANEDGVVGVTANLIDAASGEVVATTTTGVDGVYTFSGVKPGNYLVEIVEPANMGFVTQDQGGDDTTDSDVNTATGRSEPFALAAGQTVTDIDAGIEPGSLGDHVTLDMNDNGIQDAGEPGVEGIVVTLLDGDGNTVDTQTTDATGFYNFAGVAPGNYTVHFEAPSGMEFADADVGSNDTVDFDTNAAGDVSVTVVSGEGNQTIDAGIVPATLGDTVWFDSDGNGIQDAGEPGIADVMVTLLDDQGNPVQDAGGNDVTTTTDSAGNYSFSVLPGTYAVEFALPDDMAFTTQDSGGDDAKDSDADANGQTATTTLQSGESDTTLDAGIAPAMVSGTVLSDANGNGSEEAGDTGISGVVVTLSGTDILGNPVELTTTTDADGNYQFVVMPGTYDITETNPNGLVSSGSEPGTVGSTVVNNDKLEVTLASGDVSENNDFLDYEPASLSGQVREDSNADGDTSDAADTGIGGVEIMLWQDTNGDGTPDSVFANTTTNPNGEYSFLDIPPGSYVVIENDLDAYTSTGDTNGDNDNRIAVTLASGETSPNHDFLDTRPANISGQVRNDTDRDGDTNDTEPGIPGLTISLYTDPNGDGDPTDGTLVTTTTTNVQGEYQFNNVLPGDYVLVESDGTDTESTADTSGANDNQIPVTLVADTDSTDNDFLDTSVLGSLIGVVWEDTDSDGVLDAGEAGIPGVTVVVKGMAGNVIATLSTDADGNYSQDDLPAGNYKIEVDPTTLPEGVLQTGDPDAALDHETVATVVAGANTDELDFGYVQPASISNLVWHDANMNGVQDAGEAGIAEVAVKLLDNTGAVLATTLTNNDGEYSFTGLLEGDYRVEFVKPTEYIAFSPASVGSDTTLDSDVTDAATGRTDQFALAAGEDRTDIDAGLYQTASLGDTLWFDANGNGVQDAEEPGIAGAEVTLVGTLGDGSNFTPVTVQTDENGKYLFDDLLPGNYSVNFSADGSMVFTAIDQGGDDTVDSDVSIDGNASVTLASGEHNRDLDAGILPAGLTGRVWIDNETSNGLDDGIGVEEGVVGVNVNLIDVATGNAVKTTTTGPNGIYVFTGILPGDYIVEVVEPANMGFIEQDKGADDEIDSDVNTENGRTDVINISSGDNVNHIDAGIEPGELGDHVWLDENNNGLQDAGEQGVPGITVNLLNSNGDQIATQTTDATGFYNFAGVLPGDYEVEFVLPGGMDLTEQDRGTDDSLDSDADVTTQRAPVTVISGVGNQTIDAGVIPATLGDTVWLDENGDGLQDADEPVLANVPVVLIDSLGNPILDTAGNPVTVLTDEQGKYQFTVIPGSYGIHVDLPDGTSVTTLNAGDEALDSDVARATGNSAAVTLVSGDNYEDLDAGIAGSVISGTVLMDNNANGVEDADDTTPGVGITVTISGTDIFGNEVTRTVSTDANGEYSANVPPGTYTITETTPEALTSTGSEAGTNGTTVIDKDNLTVTVASGESSENNDFLNAEAASLNGQVRNDSNGDGDLADTTDAPIPGVEVFLWLDENGDGNPDEVVANTTTDASGNYAFTDLQPGNYIVAESDLTSFVSTADTAADNDNRIAVTLQSGEDSPGHDFLDTETGIISGQVRDDEDRDGDLNGAGPGLPGVTVGLFTDPNGDGNPEDGVLVTIDGTDALGNYQFTGIVPGNYVIVENDPVNYESSADIAGENDNLIPVAHVSGTDSTGNDFLDTSILGSLSGTIWQDTNPDGNREAGSETGIAGVTVLIQDESGVTLATLTTDANGYYEATELPAGTVHVVVDPTTLPAGMLQTGDPDDELNHKTLATVVGGEHIPDLDFGYIGKASVGDTVWEDLNGNGLQDDGEPGINNVAVVLSKDGNEVATTRTDSDGNYLFDGLVPGDYEISFELPEGYYVTTQDVADDDAVDSDPASDGKVSVTLNSGSDLSMDAGLYRLGALGDTVWLDMNNNGVQDDGEPAISEMTVNLLDGDGTVITDDAGQPVTTTTDEQGQYLFSDLKPGDYQVQFVAPTGITFTTADQGLDDAIDSDAQNNGIAPGVVTSGQTNNTVDAGIVPASVTGRVWIDNNTGNNLDDGEANENGVIGVRVNLIDVATGDVVATTTTGANGVYTFDGIEPGEYAIEVIEPANMGFVFPDQGSDDSIDSDVDTNTGQSAPFTLTSGAAVVDLDAGIEPGALGDHVFLDSNENGLQDSGEPGVEGVTVKLIDSNGDVLETQTTDATGFYNFAAELPGDYTVEFTLPDGMSFTTQNTGSDDTLDSDVDPANGQTTVTVISGVGNQTIDAGVIPARIGDTVWLDIDGDGTQGGSEPVIANATVTLLDENGDLALDKTGNPVTTMTDATGYYEFVVEPGSYGVQFTLPDGSEFTTQDGGSNDAADSDADPVTGKTAAVTVASGDHDQTLDAGIKPAVISGKTLQDNNGDAAETPTDTPLPGVEVTLTGTDVFGNPITQTVTTDSNGEYVFEVPPGTYTLTESNPDGYESSGAETGPDETIVNADRLEVTVVSGESAEGNDFLDYQSASLSGQVREDINGDADTTDGNDPVITDVAIMLWRDTDGDGEPDQVVGNATTDDQGNYAFTDLPPGNYIVIETDNSGFSSTGDVLGENDNTVAVTLASGEDSPGHDFLDTQPTIVSGQVREDDDRDGDLHDTDEGLEGAVVTLYTDPNGDGNPEDGQPVQTTTTDEDGQYNFAGVIPGSYVVVEEDPENYVSTGDTSGEATDNQVPVTNVSGENNTGNDFLDTKELGSVSGTLWTDIDANGEQESTEPLMAGVTVQLLDQEGVIVASTTTDAEGNYEFTDQVPGTYTVKVLESSLPYGVEQTADPDEVKDDRHSVVIEAQTDKTDVDFAYVAVSNLGNHVWHDMNANGIQDEGEPGIPGVMVRLYSDPNGDGVADDSVLLAATATNTQGNYLFSDLLPGNYVVHFETLDGHYVTSTAQGDDRAIDSNIDNAGYAAVTLTPQGDMTIDAGFWQLGSLGDRVWLDENMDGYQDAGEASISDVEVSLYDAAGQAVTNTEGQPLVTVSDENGNYHFDNLAPGEYQVRFATPDGITFTQTNRGSDDVIDSDTDANGYAEAVVTSGQHNATVDAGLIPAAISGRVWIDNNDQNGVDDGTGNEDGMVGVVVNLLDENGEVIDSTTTGVDGSYHFAAVLPGEYQLEFVEPENMQLVTADQGDDDTRDSDPDPETGRTPVFTLTSGQGITDLDAGIDPGALGDRVWLDVNGNGVQDADEPGVPDIAVHLLDQNGLTIASTSTDENGFYSFTEVTPGAYTVSFERPANADFVTAHAGSDDTADSDVDVNGAVAVTVQSGKAGDQSIDAGIVPALLGDLVWLDSNQDGMQSDDEPGLAGITVNLLDSKGEVVDSTLTDSQGNYQFAVVPGEWQVAVVAPDSQFVDSGAGVDRHLDSDVNTDGVSALQDVESGDNDLRIDAGIVPAVLSGKVIEDSNADGVVDEKDQPVPGVTITVTGSDSYGNPVSVTVLTDEQGEYQLSLPPGMYTVTETQPDDFESSGSSAPKTEGSEVVSPDQVTVKLESGWAAEDTNFLDYQPAEVTGVVYDDPNGDGNSDDGQPKAGVTMELYTDPNGDGDPSDGELIDTVLTDGQGRYLFTGLIPDDYVVMRKDPDTGADNETIPVTTGSGETVDAGSSMDTDPVTFTGSVLDDLNDNGQADSTDAGISGVTVTLYSDPNVDGDISDGVALVVTGTDTKGDFTFTDIAPGSYVVVATDAADFVSIQDSSGNNDNRVPVTLVSGQQPGTIVFLDRYQVEGFSGTVYDDTDGDADPNDTHSGLGGVIMELWSDPNGDGHQGDGALVDTAKTDNNGNYSFPSFGTGSWVIIQNNKPGYVSTGDAVGVNDDRIAVVVSGSGSKPVCTPDCAGLYFMDRLSSVTPPPGPVVTPDGAAQIPTLSEWAMILLSLLILWGSAVRLRRA